MTALQNLCGVVQSILVGDVFRRLVTCPNSIRRCVRCVVLCCVVLCCVVWFGVVRCCFGVVSVLFGVVRCCVGVVLLWCGVVCQWGHPTTLHRTPKFSFFFFPSSATIFILSSVSWVSSRGILVAFLKAGALQCARLGSRTPSNEHGLLTLSRGGQRAHSPPASDPGKQDPSLPGSAGGRGEEGTGSPSFGRFF